MGADEASPARYEYVHPEIVGKEERCKLRREELRYPLLPAVAMTLSRYCSIPAGLQRKTMTQGELLDQGHARHQEPRIRRSRDRASPPDRGF